MVKTTIQYNNKKGQNFKNEEKPENILFLSPLLSLVTVRALFSGSGGNPASCGYV